ncbi:MAG: coproporphyrinogen III oxidase family protein, partial [Campylobacterales bacterium]|nr:coproporphyrinogen III oxidase family protein [Campylobacterales bacterium]
IEKRGFGQYEISNFGTYRSRHNLGYWEHKPYIGLGCGAVGFLDHQRFYPSNSVEGYIADPLFVHAEELSDADLFSEKLFLGFRSCVGVEETFLTAPQKKQADLFVGEGLLTSQNGRYFNTDFLLADEIALRVEGF